MGRSAKNMKRPTKAEKVSRTLNTAPLHRERPRSLSPDLATRSAIPLFNTSAKRRLTQLADYDPMSLDSSAAVSPIGSDKEMSVPAGEEGQATDGGREGPKKKSLKDKIKAAREGIKEVEEKSKDKLLGRSKGKGVDKGKSGKVGLVCVVATGRKIGRAHV